MDAIAGKRDSSIFSQWVWHAIVSDGTSKYMVYTEVVFDDEPRVEEILYLKISFSKEGLKYSDVSRDDLKPKPGLIYYSPHTNIIKQESNYDSLCVDVSTDALIWDYYEDNHKDSQIVQFRRKDVKRQIEFIEFAKTKEKKLDFFTKYIRDELIVFFNQDSRVDNKKIVEYSGVDHDFYEYLNNCYENIVPILTYNIGRMKSGNEEDLVSIWLYRRLIEMVFFQYYEEGLKDKPSVKPMIDMSQKGLIDTTKLLNDEEDLLKIMRSFLQSNFTIQVTSIIDKFIDIVTTKVKFGKSFNSLTVNYKERYTFLNFESEVKSILELPNTRPLFTFDWAELSTGEKAYLNLFSRLYHGSKQKDSINKKNVIFLIDEPATGFHPNWQKEYLKNLIFIIDVLWRNKKQLIITTHSPFVLSDFQSQEVIKLSLDSNNEIMNNTFAANIHELLGDDFYLKGGFIGEMAKDKIHDAINQLNEKKEITDKNQLKRFIKIIGEPYLKKKLLDKFYRIFPEEYSKRKKIRELENELKRLKND